MSTRLDGPLLKSALESFSSMLHGPFDVCTQFPSMHADRGRANVAVMSMGVTPECGRVSLLRASYKRRVLMVPECLRISIESTRPD